jgi:hypothetical protein
MSRIPLRLRRPAALKNKNWFCFFCRFNSGIILDFADGIIISIKTHLVTQQKILLEIELETQLEIQLKLSRKFNYKFNI